MNNKKKEYILKLLEKNFSREKTDLEFKTPYQLLVATILSAQSTDKQVNKITRTLFQKYKKPKDFAILSVKQLEPMVKGCGLYKNKSKNIIEMSKILIEKHSGKVPKSREELINLPGVGRKTANVVLSNAYNIPALAVDTHVFRVSNRLGLVASKNVLQTEYQLMEVIPKEKWISVHRKLIDLGRTYCRARNPFCEKCPLVNNCKKVEEEGK